MRGDRDPVDVKPGWPFSQNSCALDYVVLQNRCLEESQTERGTI